MAFLSSGFCLYYNIVLAYCIFYMVMSVYNPQPWVGCDHEWNTENCYDAQSLDVSNTSQSSVSALNETSTAYGYNLSTAGNITGKRVRATEEYWK